MKVFANSIVLIFIALTSFAAKADQMTLIHELLGSFGSSCSIQGTQSIRLNGAATSLHSALKSMIDDQSCQNVLGAAAMTRSSLDRLTTVAPEFDFYEIEYQKSKAKKDSLVAAIATEPELLIKKQMQESLRSVELDLVTYRKSRILELANQKNFRMYDAASSFRSATDSLLSILSANEQCLQRNPSVAKALGSFGLALSQSATLGLQTSGTSILGGAGVYLISRLTQYAKDAKNAAHLREISDPLLPSALSCALENLNEIYCDSEKVERLATFVLSPEFQDLKNARSSPFVALELLEKSIPALDASLNLIRIGGDPSSSVDGQQRKSIRGQKEDLQSSKLVLVGFLADLKKSINAIPASATDKTFQIFRLQKTFISDFLSAIGIFDDSDSGSSSSIWGALYEIYSGSAARYFLMGFDQSKYTAEGTSNRTIFKKLEHPLTYNSSPLSPWVKYAKSDGTTHFTENTNLFEKEVLARFENWYLQAQGLLDTKVNLIFRFDKKEILASFDRQMIRDRKLTPMIAIQRLSEFLKSPVHLKYLGLKDRKIAEEVVAVIDNGLIAEINSIDFNLPDSCPSSPPTTQPPPIPLSPPTPPTPPACFDEAANRVFASILKSTRYEDEPRYLINRISVLIEEIVSKVSIELYQNGNADMLYALASTDVVKELQSFAGKQRSTADMAFDALKAKGQVVDLITGFVEAYAYPIKRALEDVSDPRSNNRRIVERAHLCLQLLGLDGAAPGHPLKLFEKLNLRLCEGIGYPIRPGIPNSPVVTRDVFAKKVEDRICSHQNWQRKKLLLEKGL